MSYSDNEILFRQIIMDHYQYPKNKGLVDEAGYVRVHLKNPSCGDDLVLQVKLAGTIIEDIRFEGTGCAICCASASMLTSNVKGIETMDALAFLRAFSDMMLGKNINETVLGDAIALQGTAKLPPRIKCATLSHKALERVLTDKAIEDNELEEVQVTSK